MYKKYIVFICFIVSTFSSFGQKGNMSKGDRYFDLNMFKDAIPYYEEASKEGKPKDKEAALNQLANCYRIIGEFELAEKTFTKILKNKKTPPESYLNYGLALKASAKYSEAIAAFDKYKSKNPADSATANRMIKSCVMAQSWLDEVVKYDVKLVEKVSEESPDFAAVYYKNGIVFSSTREDSKKPLLNFSGTNTTAALDYYYTDISVPVDSIKRPVLFGNINTVLHEGPATFSKDFSRIYITKTVSSGKSLSAKRLKTLQIFKSEKDSAGNWKEAVSAFSFNSSSYSIGHPSITPNGDRIYFMSDMPGGIGGTDLYYADLMKNGEWGKPVNLGVPINTKGNELFPFISEENILYFSSNMHPGMGKLDIFSANLSEGGTWSEPENLRTPINSIGDDFAFVKQNSYKRGFLSSDRFNGKGADDIYSFIEAGAIQLHAEGTRISVLDQTFYDGIIYKLVNDSTKEERILTSVNGKYEISLDTNVSYTLTARKDGFKYARIGLIRNIAEKNHHLNLAIKPFDKPVKVGGSLLSLDSTQTKEGPKLRNSTVFLLKNENEMMRQSVDDSSNYFFDVELTKGKVFRLVDDAVIVKEEEKLTQNDSIVKDTLVTYVSLKGNVLCDGKPVDNAQISFVVNSNVEKNTSSTSVGEFSFEHVSTTQKFQLIATKSGYDSVTMNIDFSTTPFDSSKVITILMSEKFKVHVSGVVKSKDSVVAQAQLDVYSNIEEMKTHYTNDEGKFKFSVNPDGQYSMTVNKKGFLPAKTDLPINDLNDSSEIQLNIQLDSLKMDQVMTINIYYEFDKSDIKRESELELDKFVSFMKINPTVSIEVSAHTDERGSDSYNLNLSKERARKVMNYLVSEGGVRKDRIISNGFGENKPIVKNAQTDEEHQKNRRTEVKIIGL